MKIEQFKKRLLIFGIIALFLIALPITIYLVRQQQTIEQRAEEPKSVSLTPQNVQVEPGGKAEFTLSINPQGAAVRRIKLVLNYPTDKLEATNADFEFDSSFKLTEDENISISNGTVTLEFGSPTPGNWLQAQTTIGKLSFKAIGTSGQIAPITFDTTLSEVKDGNLTVITGYTFANSQVSIGAPVCPGVGQAECKWDAVTGADSYHYKITKVGDAAFTIEDDTTDTKVTFNSETGATYTCEVFAQNNCGNQGEGDSDTQVCISTSPTPTGSLTPTLTPTLTTTNTPTLTPTVTHTNTPTPTKSPTPTPTTVITSTLTPTLVITSTPTPTLPPDVTPTNTPTPTPVEIVVITNTPVPTLPATGANVTTIGAIVAGVLIILGGLVLLIL